MKPTIARVVFLALLAVSTATRAKSDEPLVEMHHQIVGPAVKTWSLRLEPDGKIVEERFDWSKKRYHVVRTRCRLSKDATEQAREAAQRVMATLPVTIADGSIAFDGPSKRLRVRQESDERTSYWMTPEGANASDEAKAFVRAWEEIEGVLKCGTQR